MTLLAIDSIHVGERVRRDMGDLPALSASIERVGLLHPIVVMERDGRVTLVAGERRLRACRSLGWERIPIRMLPDGVDLLRAEHDENVVREPFTTSEAVEIARLLAPIEKAEARERMEAGTPSVSLTKGRSEDRIAAAVGMSRNTLAKATEIVEAAEADPLLAPLVEVLDETGNVSGTHAALQALPPEPAPEQVQAAVAAVRSRMTTGLMSSRSDDWHTPPSVLDRVTAALGAIDLDPCADSGRKVPAAAHFTPDDDGLSRDWSGRVFMNPPYGDAISGWVDKLAAEIASGRVSEAVTLLPARTDTGWWARVPGTVVCFVTGRLRFSGADPAPFPSAVVYAGVDSTRFAAAFADAGLIYERVEP